MSEKHWAIEKLWHEGKGYDKIARELGLTRGVVAGICRRRGLRRNMEAVVDPIEKLEQLAKEVVPVEQTSQGVVAEPVEEEEEIDTSEVPEVGEDWFKKAKVVEPGVSIIDHQEEQCRWPLDKGRDGLMRFCGRPKRSILLPYCPEHTLRSSGGRR